MGKTDQPPRMYRLSSLIATALTVVVFLSVSLFGLIQSYRMYTAQEKGVRKQLTLNSLAAANEVGSFLVTIGFNLEAVVTLNLEQLTSEDPAVRARMVARLMRLIPTVRQITLLNAEGAEITKMSRFKIVSEQDYSSQARTPLWDTIITGDRYLSSVRFGAQTTEPIVSMAQPLVSLTDGVIGAVIADIDLTHLWRLVTELTLGEKGCSYVLDGEERVLAHSDMTRINLGDTLEHAGLTALLSTVQSRQGGIVKDKYGNLAMAASAAIENTDWSFVTELPIEEAQREASADLLLSGVILLFTLLVSVSAGIFLANRLSRSLNKLKDGARIVAAGDFEHRIVANAFSVVHIEEVHTLITAFNGMVDHIAAKNEALSERVEQIQSIYANLPVLIWAVDNEGIITLAEGSELIAFGIEPGESVGKSAFDYYQGVFPKTIESIHKCLEGTPVNFEVEASGGVYYVILTPILDEHNTVLGARGLAVNITETRRATEEVKRLRNYLTNIIDSMPSILVGVDSNGLVTQWNKTAEAITGIRASVAHGKHLADILPGMAKEMEKIKNSIVSRTVCQERRQPQQHEDGIHYEDLTIYPLVTDGVEGAVIRIDDVTEKVRMEEMMTQSEKMLSVGGLAAGMAHEINNPLAGMLQTAEVMSSRLGERVHVPASIKAAEQAGVSLDGIAQFMEARGIPRMLKTINESGKRIAVIVHNMLSFARKGESIFSNHDLCDLMDKTLELAATDYDLKKKYDFKQVAINKEYAPDLPVVACEAAKIQQVLLNILTNGAQEMLMSEVDHPQFSIRISHDAQPNMIRLEIEDNGPGIADEIKSRIFEPFFTTKPVGIGTGLGLSVSYFIITEVHSGDIDVQSVPGQGATFIIRLPVNEG